MQVLAGKLRCHFNAGNTASYNYNMRWSGERLCHAKPSLVGAILLELKAESIFDFIGLLGTQKVLQHNERAPKTNIYLLSDRYRLHNLDLRLMKCFAAANPV